MNKDKEIKIKNRSDGTVVYVIPELGDKRNICRSFAAGESKTITMEELEALTFVPGGTVLIKDYLQILDDEALNSISVATEPEYKMSEADIKNLILYGSQDEFLDCLDFAPAGVIDLIKSLAISLPMNDNAKREALFKATGFSVEKAISIQNQAKAAENAPEVKTKERRVRVEGEPARRTAPPKYKVVNTIE